ELRYVQRLLDQRVATWEELTQSSIEEVFELGEDARALLVQFLTDAPEEALDEVLTFQTMTAGTVTASKHLIASNIFLHDIRHWAQIATVLRQNGFEDQWGHDLLLSGIKI
ncbi:MAG TPA: DinB family protein, partial [Gemmatimonadaceae bacterium]